MHCREFESRLNDILDDRGQPRADAQLAAHADVCEACRQLLAGEQVLFAGLRHRPLPPVSAGFAGRVVAQARPVSVVSRSSASRVWWALATVLSTAAAVLLIVSLVWQARRGNVRPPNDQLVNETPSAPAGHTRAPGSGLALSQGDWLIEAPRLPSRIRGGYRGTIDNLAVALPETVQRAGEHIAPGIRPIRISFGVLLDALWRTFPGSHDAEQPTRTSYHALDLRQLA